MLRIFSLVIVLSGLWLGLSGFFEPLMLSFGAASVLLVVWISHRMELADHEGHPIHLSLRAIPYIAWLLKEIVVANIDVAKVILGPMKNIKPQMFSVEGSQHSELGHVTYANSITLTPGTVTCQVEDGELLVHALTSAGAAGVKDGVMDRKVTALEGLGVPLPVQAELLPGERG